MFHILRLALALSLVATAEAQDKPVEKPAEPAFKVSWKDGKTTIDTEKAQLNITNRIQFRWTQESPDAAVQLAGIARAGGGRGSFRVRRARLKLDGWIYRRELQYEAQIDWTGGANMIQDMNLNWEIRNNRRLMLKAGQFKVPFGRQQLTSIGSQQFVDRSIVSDEYEKGRDQGVQLWGELSKGKVEWRGGVFNGNGRGAAVNDNGKYQYNARVTWQPNGNHGLSEGDFESKDKPLYALAANFERNDLRGATAAMDYRRTIFGFDAAFKYKGFSFLAEYFDRSQDPETGAAFKSNGYHVQSGFLIGAKRKWELALRYGTWEPTDRIGGDDRTELGGAFNYYNNKHNLKVQADLRRIEDKARRTKDGELRVQTQFTF